MGAQSEKPRIDNSTYNILVALGIEANFLHSTVDTYISDAQKENNAKLVEVWNMIKRDKEKHLQMLKDCLETEVKEGQTNR
jgi:hypothetical protein